MITIATPLSAVNTMQSLSYLSSLIAEFWALVRLGLVGWEDLSTWLTSALSSSASCQLSLVQAASIAVIYSKLGGCLGVTAKLGPLASTDLCTGVKGLLDRLITHFGFRFLQGGRTLQGAVPMGERPCFLGSIVLGRYPLADHAVLLTDHAVLPREVPACLSLSLAEHLTAWGGAVLSAWRVMSFGEEGELAWESSLSASERVLYTREAWELPAWESSLSAGERMQSTGEAWELPAWESSLSASERVLSSGESWELPAWKKSLWGRALSSREDWELLAWESSLSASESVLSTSEAWELPAWERWLWGRALSPREGWELPVWEDWGLPAWEIALSAGGRVLSAKGPCGLPVW